MRQKRKKQYKKMKLIKIIAEIFQYLDKDTVMVRRQLEFQINMILKILKKPSNIIGP